VHARAPVGAGARAGVRARRGAPGPGAPLSGRIALALALAFGPALGAPGAGAQPRVAPDGGIVYTVAPGDTLIGLGERLLDPPARWRDVQRLNRIAVPRRLAPGTELRIDPAWLRGEPAEAELGTVAGTVALDGAPAAAGASGREGSRIETGADGVVVVRLRDGTTLTIPPASTVRFERLRRYLGSDAVEAAIAVERGAVETRATPGRARPLRIRTPAVTAAVRGTEFRVRSRDERGDETAIEVLAGAVGAEGSAGRADLDAGQGAIAVRDRPPRVESLLAAPALAALPARVETPAATLRFAPVPGAGAYRVRVARDEAFTRPVADTLAAEPQVVLRSEADGPLHVRARAVSAIGLEGREALAVVEVAARPEPPLPIRPPERAVVFGTEVALAWAQPDGIGAFRIQVAADEGFGTPVADLVVESASASVTLPETREGARGWWWRIASIDRRGTAPRQGPFSAPRRFEQRPVGGAPSGSVDDASIALSWPGQPGQRWQLQMAGEPGFAAPLLERELAEPRVTLEGLAPGVYWLRTRTIDADGAVAPFGPAQRFEIRSLLRSGSGAPVGSGAGTPVELTDPR
jgi:hypothetical protein